MPGIRAHFCYYFLYLVLVPSCLLPIITTRCAVLYRSALLLLVSGPPRKVYYVPLLCLTSVNNGRLMLYIIQARFVCTPASQVVHRSMPLRCSPVWTRRSRKLRRLGSTRCTPPFFSFHLSLADLIDTTVGHANRGKGLSSLLRALLSASRSALSLSSTSAPTTTSVRPLSPSLLACHADRAMPSCRSC
jgi:hypothetical protein